MSQPARIAAILAPELAWTGERFEPGIEIELRDDGRFGRVGRAGDRTAREAGPTSGASVQRLDRVALMPGFVNVHSHAFQRGLRGRGELFPAGAGSFWSWREAMYDLVERLDAERIHAISLRCFREMLVAGITAVGEFHYVHRGPDGRWRELDEAVLRAARDAGIRIVLLQCAYRSGAIGRPLAGGQVRFDTASLAEYWERFDHLSLALDGRTQSMAPVAHSVRAVPWEEVVAMHEESRRRGLVFHMHVEEVIPEIADCLAAHGRRPMQMIVEDLRVDGRFTAVHCTHTDPRDMARFVAAGGTVAICPLTEGNLGDGVPATPEVLAAGGRIAFGTDLNSRLCAPSRNYAARYLQRLVRRERGALRDAGGSLVPRLVSIATVDGARSLGLDAGRIAEGALADLVAIDLAHPTLEGWTPETLAASLVFGAGNAVIAGVWVGGRPVSQGDGGDISAARAGTAA
ncbi:MAG: formimidoylglutamate deiminase [Phycisphaerales bacterium]